MYNTALILHILAIISWMAGILYLFRLFIYHRENQGKENIDDLFTLMEQRLYRGITVPAMVIAWLAGLYIVYLNPALLSLPWFHLKLSCAVLMTLNTLYAGRLRKKFLIEGASLPTSKRLRFLNEVPTLLMVVIVIMVIARPF